MGTIDQMSQRIAQKLDQGFRCIKFKIGGEDFDSELALLSQLRSRFAPEQLEIRLDANGAFAPDEAIDKLSELARLHIHSIEQPIRPRQRTEMARICRLSPIPVALDEELIGIDNPEEKLRMLSEIAPRYIILKPALCGGISGAMEWISLARLSGTGWWATSALESNVGLNAIAQWVATLAPTLPQGLGTGQLYTDNIPSPLEQKGTKLFTNPALGWDLTQLQWQS